jgi:hypothetical protein
MQTMVMSAVAINLAVVTAANGELTGQEAVLQPPRIWNREEGSCWGSLRTQPHDFASASGAPLAAWEVTGTPPRVADEAGENRTNI